MANQIYEASLISARKIQYGHADDLLLPHRDVDQYFPTPYMVKDDGTIEFCLYYPNASMVEVQIFGKGCFALTKDGDFFKGSVNAGVGVIGVTLLLDGNEALSPYLPVCYSGNLQLNYVDVPDPELILPEQDIPHGTVSLRYLHSKITNRLERFVVYTPPMYEQESQRRFPVLYLQHGHGENEMSWYHLGKMNFTYDHLIAEKRAEPAIVVMCNGMYYDENTSGIDLRMEKLGQLLLGEIIPFIESSYRTFTDREHRAMAGLSMGSMQTSMLTLLHPEMFGYVGVFSGFVQEFLCGHTDHVQEDKLKRFAQDNIVYYRAMGDEDIHFSHFEDDDALLTRYNIPCTRKIYHGEHDWKVWRYCIYDFAQMIFKGEQ